VLTSIGSSHDEGFERAENKGKTASFKDCEILIYQKDKLVDSCIPKGIKLFS
jgi:hypothetical protein